MPSKTDTGEAFSSKELLNILLQGAGAWNSYRENNPDLTPILTGANLSVANLSGTDLRGARLSGANLSKANLSKTDLSGTDLTVANLREANLHGANLSKANLSEAQLGNANFTNAIVTDANFTGVGGLSSLKGMNLAKGLDMAHGLEGIIWSLPDVKVKQTDVDSPQQFDYEEFRQQAPPESKIPNSGDDESTEEDKTTDSENPPEVEGHDLNANEPPPAEDSPTETVPNLEPKVWLTSGTPTKNPGVDLLTKEPGSTTTWVVPKGTAAGDYILFWVAESHGLLYGCKVIKIKKERSRTDEQRKLATLEIKVRFDPIIPFAKLKADDVLNKWPLVRSRMQGTARSQTQDLRSQPDIWAALKNLVISESPNTIPFFAEIEGEKAHAKLSRSWHSDMRATRDMLGHDRIVKVLAAFLKSERTRFPLSIAIDAPWGTGKSTVMYLLQNDLQYRDKTLVTELRNRGMEDDQYIELLEDVERKKSKRGALTFTWNDLLTTLTAKEKDQGKERGAAIDELKVARTSEVQSEAQDEETAGDEEPASTRRSFETVYFNAWRHGSGDRLTASMVSHVINTIADRKGTIERERFWLNLNLARLDLTTLRRDMHLKILKSSTEVLSLLGSFIFLLLLTVVALVNDHSLSAGISALFSGGSLVAVKKYWKKAKDKTVSYDFSPHFRAPDYEKLIGPQTNIEKDFLHVIKSLKEDEKSLAVFIDDLDRCPPNQVVDVVEAINVFFGQQCKDCVFIIGMHRDLVATSLELGYKELVSKIEEAPHLSEELPYGQRFLEKIVQFVVRLPEPGDDDIERFVSTLAASETVISTPVKEEMKSYIAMKSDPDFLTNQEVYKERLAADYESFGFDKEQSVKMSEKDIRVESAVHIAETYEEKTTETIAIFKLVKEALRSNPRQYVRFFNALRFDYYLSADDQTHEPTKDDLLIMAKWVVISLEWPVLANLISAKRKRFNNALRGSSGAGDAAVEIEKLVKESIDPNSDKGEAFFNKMKKDLSDPRMVELLNVKIPRK